MRFKFSVVCVHDRNALHGRRVLIRAEERRQYSVAQWQCITASAFRQRAHNISMSKGPLMLTIRSCRASCQSLRGAHEHVIGVVVKLRLVNIRRVHFVLFLRFLKVTVCWRWGPTVRKNLWTLWRRLTVDDMRAR